MQKLQDRDGIRRPALGLAIFCGLAALALALMGPLSGLLYGAAPWLGGAFIGSFAGAILFFMATAVCLRLDKVPFSALGLDFSGRRLKELLIGILAGTVLYSLLLLIRAALVGAEWTVNPSLSIQALILGLFATAFSVVVEELMFRGYGFVHLVRAVGPKVALGIAAALFGAYHVLIWNALSANGLLLVATSALGSLLFGVAFLRTGGMVLPIGLHLGGNWVQASLFRMGEAQDGTAVLVARLSSEAPVAESVLSLSTTVPYFLLITLGLAALLWWRRDETLTNRLMPVWRPR